jgi:hypothetical protein
MIKQKTVSRRRFPFENDVGLLRIYLDEGSHICGCNCYVCHGFADLTISYPI